MVKKEEGKNQYTLNNQYVMRGLTEHLDSKIHPIKPKYDERCEKGQRIPQYQNNL